MMGFSNGIEISGLEFDISSIQENDIFILGCSTSEILGYHIGSMGNQDIAKLIIKTVNEILDQRNIYLVVQCCEHLNRVLVVERNTLIYQHNTEVLVIPTLKAGGACAAEAWGYLMIQ